MKGEEVSPRKRQEKQETGENRQTSIVRKGENQEGNERDEKRRQEAAEDRDEVRIREDDDNRYQREEKQKGR